MKKFTIEDLSEGRCAVVNDGTVDELWEVLGNAFPKHPGPALATRMIYRSNPENNNYWYCCDKTDLPTQSVKDFLEKEEESEEWKPKKGERVLVRNGDADYWHSRIFVRENNSSNLPYVTARAGFESYFLSGDSYFMDSWQQIKPYHEDKPQQPPLTSLDYDQLGEIAKTDNDRGREALRMLLEAHFSHNHNAKKLYRLIEGLND